MIQLTSTQRDRAKSIVGVVAIHAAIGWALIRGLNSEVAVEVPDDLKLIDVRFDPPPPQ